MDEMVETFREAAESFVGVVAGLYPASWDQPALGEWTVRDLVGHTSRALSTVESYLDRPAASAEIADAAGYYLATASAVDPTAVAQRGREAGAGLGEDPFATITRLAATSAARVAAAPPGTVVTTVVGAMHLADYLRTRILELTVHSLDLLVATGRPPRFPARPMRVSLHLAADLAVRQGTGDEVALALTGRRPLPAGFSVV